MSWIWQGNCFPYKNLFSGGGIIASRWMGKIDISIKVITDINEQSLFIITKYFEEAYKNTASFLP